MKRLSRDDILNAKDIEQKEVEVKEWGGSVLVQTLSARRRSDIMDSCMDDKGKLIITKLYPALMIAGCVEPKLQKADVEVLNEKSSKAIERVCKVIMELSGIAEDDLTTEKN